jgi:formylglycine-generating enzyme required for sulfatase activity
MIWIHGGTFRMGSDQHYPEEAPVHRVTVSGFWIDRTPVTNRQFKEFVRAIGHRTFAEIPPEPKNYAGALPHMLYAGSLVFTPPSHPVDLKILASGRPTPRVLIGGTPTGRRATSTRAIIIQWWQGRGHSPHDWAAALRCVRQFDRAVRRSTLDSAHSF